jgi:predicted chitinase
MVVQCHALGWAVERWGQLHVTSVFWVAICCWAARCNRVATTSPWQQRRKLAQWLHSSGGSQKLVSLFEYNEHKLATQAVTQQQ